LVIVKSKIDVVRRFACIEAKLNSNLNKNDISNDTDTITQSANKKLKKLDFLLGMFIYGRYITYTKFKMLIIYIPMSVIF